jgi:hypothetical protein
MVQALFGQIKGVFGKSYFLAGMIPAAIIIVGLRWLTYGSDGVKAAVNAVLAPSNKLAFEGVENAALLLMTALAFFAIRGIVIDTFQSMSWSVLTPLRNWMVAMQMRRYRKATLEREKALYDLTVLSWRTRKYEPGEYIPQWFKVNELPLVLKKSSKARSEAKRLVEAPNTDAIGEKDAKLIIDGYREFYSLFTHFKNTGKEDHSLSNELEEWRKLQEKPSVLDAFHILELRANAHWLHARKKREQFPASETWMEPTAFGNRFAALDDYGEKRYNIDTTTIWRRIWGILPAREREEISDAKLSIEVTLNICVAFGLLGAAAAISVIFDVWSDVTSKSFVNLALIWHAIWFALGAEVFAFLMYKLAVQAASALAENIVRAVDLYRLKVIVALGYACPTKVVEELDLMAELSGFFTQGDSRRPDRLLKAVAPEAIEEEGKKKKKEVEPKGTEERPEKDESSDIDDSSE